MQVIQEAEDPLPYQVGPLCQLRRGIIPTGGQAKAAECLGVSILVPLFDQSHLAATPLVNRFDLQPVTSYLTARPL